MLRLLNFSFNGDIHWFFYYKHQSRQYDSPVLFTNMLFRFRKHKGHDLAYDVSAEVIKNCDKYIFVGRCLLILLTRQFLI
jgi:hypothetical protein